MTQEGSDIKIKQEITQQNPKVMTLCGFIMNVLIENVADSSI